MPDTTSNLEAIAPTIPQEPPVNEGMQDRNWFIHAHVLRFTLNFLEWFDGSIELHQCNLFEPVARELEGGGAEAMARAICSPELLRQMESAKGFSRVDFDIDPPQEILRIVWNHPSRRQALRQALVAHLRPKLGERLRLAALSAETDPVQQRFAEVVRVFALEEAETDLLLFAFLRAQKSWEVEFHSVFAIQSFLAAALHLPRQRCAILLAPKAKLRRYRLLDASLEFGTEVGHFLTGTSDEPLISHYYTPYAGSPLPWMMHGQLAERHGQVLKTLLASRDVRAAALSVLFYGEPGTGKTEFTQSLASELGRQLYVIRHGADVERAKGEGSVVQFRFAAIQLCDAQVDPARSLILIDEADELLRGRSELFGLFFSGNAEGSACGDKGMLNTVLDKLKTPCIWITNTDPECLDPSSRRRFDYSIRFDKLSQSQRRQVWRNATIRYELAGVIGEDQIDAWAKQYEISAGGISLAARNCADVLRTDPAMTPESARKLVENLLAQHCELLNGDAGGPERESLSRGYCLEGVNVRGHLSPKRVLEAARRFREQQSRPSDAAVLDTPRMNILLSGPPGTGKTEYVKYLGHTLDCRVMTQMAGDLLNRFVGGTERNIRRAFRAAETERAILFIDEADGLFRSRQLAERSWEVTQVNELLHAMENFNGILICATNCSEDLDPATIRRFTFKLQFDYLTDEGKLQFYQRMFADLVAGDLSPAQRRCIIRMDRLTPGDFRTVRQALYYLGGDKITHDRLIEALEGEVDAKQQEPGSGRRIGFTT